MNTQQLLQCTTMIWWRNRIFILVCTNGVLVSSPSHGHEAQDFISRCKSIAESTVMQPSWIRKWDIHEPIAKSNAILFLEFRHPRIDGVREVFCAYSRETGRLQYLIIDGITIPIRDGEADQELLLELRR